MVVFWKPGKQINDYEVLTVHCRVIFPRLMQVVNIVIQVLDLQNSLFLEDALQNCVICIRAACIVFSSFLFSDGRAAQLKINA